MTAASMRFTVDAERLAACSERTSTFSAGLLAHAANSPSSTTDTRSHTGPRTSRKDQNSATSRAYAWTVFGDRSIPVNHPRNSSITSTTRPSGPTTVHDSTPLDGIRTRRATNPRRVPSD